MSESEITDVYNKMLEDLVRLCRILLNYQMIHGVDAEDIVQRVVLRALEKKEQLANHKNLYGWFVNACKLECITLARRSRIERRRLGISLPLEPEILIEKQQENPHRETTGRTHPVAAKERDERAAGGTASAPDPAGEVRLSPVLRGG